VNPIRILIADDQPLFRSALAALLSAQANMEVVGEAENGMVATEMAIALQPDLVIMDVEMPVMNGVEAVRLIREQVMDVKVVMLTVSETDDHVFDALENGAHGYLLKNLRPDQLFDMINAVLRNETPISPAVTGKLVTELQRHERPGTTPKDNKPQLSRRELEILRLVAAGLANKEIGRRLSITEGTVKNHIHNSLEKLGMANRIQAAAFIVRQGLGRPDL
jgi:DNA-binding NarL/FixJ family response regulator